MSGTVLVTGASRGIGRAVTRLLVQIGHEVVGVYREAAEPANALVAELGPAVQMLRCDLTLDAEVDALARDLAQRGSKLVGVVCSAGTTSHATLDADGDDLDRQIRVNLRAPLMLLRALLRADTLASPGAIVLVGSNLARHGLAGRVAYGAAKAGIEGATRSLARELGPRQIRVNAIAPGLLRTDMTATMGEDALAAYAGTVPLGRVGLATDIAPLAAFLVGPGADYITGQVIDVDGGWGC